MLPTAEGMPIFECSCVVGVPHYHSQEEEEESTNAQKLLEGSDAKQSALDKSGSSSSDVVTMEDAQGTLGDRYRNYQKASLVLPHIEGERVTDLERLSKRFRE